MTDEITEALGSFYDYVWGAEPTGDKPIYVYLPVEFGGKFTPYMFAWPRQRKAIIQHTLKWTAGKMNVFYSPALFARANPEKSNVLGSWVLWVDFDGNAPDWSTDPFPDVPTPTMQIQSSIPGHEHDYWLLSEFLDDPETLEERNRSLAYLMHADTSGWDADQILRPPFTMNHKRGVPVTIKAVVR